MGASDWTMTTFITPLSTIAAGSPWPGRRHKAAALLTQSRETCGNDEPPLMAYYIGSVSSPATAELGIFGRYLVGVAWWDLKV
jgi:hypothetical protein